MPKKVVILCGGRGTRLREFTSHIPKPMTEIGGRPILWHIMKLYAHFGFSEFILCLGYKGHVVKDFFQNYKVQKNDVTIQLGRSQSTTFHNTHDQDHWSVTLAETGADTMTGGRLKRVSKYLEDETFCFTYGDGVGNINIRELIEFHRAHGKLGTVTGVRPPSRFGELALEGNQVVAFTEKPQVSQGYINGGFFVFEKRFIDEYIGDDEGVTLEKEPLNQLAADNELMMYPHDGFWQPMDTYREWQDLERRWNIGDAPWKLWEADRSTMGRDQ